MTRAKTSAIGIAILRYLRDLEARNAGFERRGVRGWASAAEIQKGTSTSWVSEDLAQLGRRGLVARDDARIPGAAKPLWVYRITDAGARHLSELDASPHVSVAEPTTAADDRVYVRRGVQAALRAMRHATLEALPKPVVPDVPEWRTSLQLTQWLGQEAERTGGPEEQFLSDDLAAAVAAGLAERRDEPAILYRITAPGLALQPMVWHEPGAPALA